MLTAWAAALTMPVSAIAAISRKCANFKRLPGCVVDSVLPPPPERRAANARFSVHCQ